MSMPIGAIPVLPLKNTVLYPGITQTLRVGRDKSLKAVDAAMLKDNWIVTLAQRHPDKPIENPDELYHWGTLAKIESIKGTHEQGYFVTLRGYHRMKVNSFKTDTEIYEAYTERVDDTTDVDPSTEGALLTSLRQISIEVLQLVPGNTEQAQELVLAIEDVGLLSYLAAANIEITLDERQHLLEMTSIKDRGMLLLTKITQKKDN
jgi:ATP-dependent Lon protease